MDPRGMAMLIIPIEGNTELYILAKAQLNASQALIYGIPVNLNPLVSRTGNVTGLSRLCGSGTPFLLATLLPECIAFGQ